MPQELVYKPVGKEKTTGMISPPKFIPSYYEWLKEKSQQILMWGSTNGVIYTVPKGNILYITAACLSMNNEHWVGMGGPIGTLRIGPVGAGGDLILSIKMPDAIFGTNTVANNYSIPLKVNAGETVSMSEPTNTNVYAEFQGFLVKEEYIKIF